MLYILYNLLCSEWTDVSFNAAEANATQDEADREIDSLPLLNKQHKTG